MLYLYIYIEREREIERKHLAMLRPSRLKLLSRRPGGRSLGANDVERIVIQ